MKFLALALGALSAVSAFQSSQVRPTTTKLSSHSPRLLDDNSIDRRCFFAMAGGLVAASGFSVPAQAEVFFDPAQYGDQELRVSAVDSLKERVRRAILQDPKLLPSFYQLSILDGISYNAQTKAFGPDGSIIKVVLSSKNDDDYTKNLQKAALALVEAEKALRGKTAISLSDAVAIGGAEAVESVGGPTLVVQLGRADAPLKAAVSNVPIDLLSGKRPIAEVGAAFRQAGLTEREMTALMGALMTLELVEKARDGDDWRRATRPKFREAGKMGRMSEFKALTEEDIAQAELEADPDYEDPDDGWYIADSFGTKESRFGERLGKDDINEQTFNKYLKGLTESTETKKKKGSEVGNPEDYGWVAELLLDPQNPTAQTWLKKYASSNLSYLKDLNVAFNAVTQLGAVYTGGKYESLLKNKKRKSLNDDDLKLF